MKKDNKKVSDSKRGFLKGLGTVAAATPIIGSMFGSDDAKAAKADNDYVHPEVHILNHVHVTLFVHVFFFWIQLKGYLQSILNMEY